MCLKPAQLPVELECKVPVELLLDECDSIEIATRGQASNKLWLALHNGRITSSRFGEILHRRESTNPQNLVKRIQCASF